MKGLDFYRCTCLLSHLSCVWLCTTLWPEARQAPLFMGILQARILKWVPMPSSRRSSWIRDWTRISYVSCIGRRILYHEHHLGSLGDFYMLISKSPSLLSLCCHRSPISVTFLLAHSSSVIFSFFSVIGFGSVFFLLFSSFVPPLLLSFPPWCGFLWVLFFHHSFIFPFSSESFSS